MSEETRSQLLPGVFLTCIQTKKFKSSVLSMTFLTPLRPETAAANALIPYLLRRGSEAHPDLRSISAALDRLYGGTIEPMVRKKGEVQCLGLGGSFLDDSYTLDGSGILDQAAELMGELLLRPRTEAGAFCPDYTHQEKDNLIRRIQAEINDKQRYASNRLIQEMCAGEPYGVDPLGRVEDVEALTPESLWKRYQELLGHSQLELYYCGRAEPDRVRFIFQKALSGLPREGDYQVPGTGLVSSAQPPRRVEESLDVTQGKLAMGFRSGGVNLASPAFPAFQLFNGVFGWTSNSKLNLSVRERLSLCYYIFSVPHMYKGLMVVSSGIDFSKRQQVEDEVMVQLEACRAGCFDEEELKSARRSEINYYRSLLDARSGQEDWWLGLAALGLHLPPEEMVRRLETVTAEDVVAAAKAVSLDTVYFLMGREV